MKPAFVRRADQPALHLALGPALVVLLAACGAAATPGPPVRTTNVDLPPSYRFAPIDIVVSAGDTVTWTNTDNFSHSVQFLDGGLPTDPLIMDLGDSATFTFNQPGLIHYHCSFHPNDMKGTVTVEP